MQPGQGFAAFEELAPSTLLEPDAPAVGLPEPDFELVELVDLAPAQSRSFVGASHQGPS